VPLRRGVIDRVRRWRTTSDALCRAPRSAWPGPDSVRSTEDRVPRILVKGCGFFCPERLPSTSAPLGPLSRSPVWWEPATSVSALPPRTRLPTRLRDPELSPGVARPGLAFLGCSPRRRDGPNVACRLLQPISIREHDRRIVRTPRTVLMVAHERSCFSNRSLAETGRIAGGCARAHANQDVTGQGPARGRLPSMHGSSRRDRSRWELHPNPIGSDTSCREIVAPPAGDRRCQAITWMTSLRTRPACPASPRCSPSRVASRKPPRRGMRSAEPEVPSIGGPPRERWVPSSPGCPQPVE